MMREYVDLYTPEQRRVLELRPGSTDLASVKYRRESELLAGSQDPDRTYVQETLVRARTAAMGISARVAHLPEWMLNSTAKMGDGCKSLGLPAPWTSEIKGRLLGDFYVDGEPIKRELGWQPPYTLEEGIRNTLGG